MSYNLLGTRKWPNILLCKFYLIKTIRLASKYNNAKGRNTELMNLHFSFNLEIEKQDQTKEPMTV